MTTDRPTYCTFCQTAGHDVVDCPNIDPEQLAIEQARRDDPDPDDDDPDPLAEDFPGQRITGAADARPDYDTRDREGRDGVIPAWNAATPPDWFLEFGLDWAVPDVVTFHPRLTDVVHNDVCPSFAADGYDMELTDVRLWIEHPDVDRREFPEAVRFHVEDLTNERTVFASETDIDGALAAFFDYIAKGGFDVRIS